MKKMIRRIVATTLICVLAVPSAAMAQGVDDVSSAESQQATVDAEGNIIDAGESLEAGAANQEETNVISDYQVEDLGDEPDLLLEDEFWGVESLEADYGLAGVSITDGQPLELLYDDRYSFEEEYPDYEIFLISKQSPSSYKVDGGKVTNTKDTVITSMNDGHSVQATGTGTALITLVNSNDPKEMIRINVTVSPARLSLLLLAGQSNIEGLCSQDGTTVSQRVGQSIANEDGTVYSTYLPTSDTYVNRIASTAFSDVCRASNMQKFIPGSLTGKKSIYGSYLEYPINTLTESGSGKCGIDSALAYEWHQLTGDKVWVVNAGWSSTQISGWVPGGTYYYRALTAFNTAAQTYAAEILAGHYTAGNTVMFWLQGETDKSLSATEYLQSFSKMYQGFKSSLSYSASDGAKTVNVALEAIGMVSVRGSDGSYTNAEDIAMTGPRLAQYGIAASTKYLDVFMVSNDNEQWVSNEGVQNYFQTQYPEGVLDYPTQSGASIVIPKTVKEVHGDIHYTQIGHNENGISAAKGMYAALQNEEEPQSVSFADYDANVLDSKEYRILQGTQNAIVPMVYPIYTAKKVDYKASGSSISYNLLTSTVTGASTGASTITASYNGTDLVKQTVFSSNSIELKRGYTGFYYYHGVAYYLVNGMTTSMNGLIQDKNKVLNKNGCYYYAVINGKVDTSWEGLIKYNGTWWYFVKGRIATEYSGVVYNSSGHWCVQNGKVNFSYNGFAKNSAGTYFYFVNGKVNYNLNGLVKIGNSWWWMENGRWKQESSVVQNSSGWWKVTNGKVDFSYTGVAKNSAGWWRIVNGKVDFSCNSVEKNEYGWWYIRKGKVDFSYTGIAKNSSGWWRIVNGKVDFTCNSVEKNEYGWWYLSNGRIDFGYTGIGHNSSGDWYCKNGKVDFSYNGFYEGTEDGQPVKYLIADGKASKLPDISFEEIDN